MGINVPPFNSFTAALLALASVYAQFSPRSLLFLSVQSSPLPYHNPPATAPLSAMANHYLLYSGRSPYQRLKSSKMNSSERKRKVELLLGRNGGMLVQEPSELERAVDQMRQSSHLLANTEPRRSLIGRTAPNDSFRAAIKQILMGIQK